MLTRRQLPNAITAARLAGCAVFAALFLVGALRAALALYLALEAADQLDGKLAKRWRVVTVTGGYFDPFVDSLTHLTAFACLMQAGQVPLWAFLVLLARELGLLFLRLLAVVQGLKLKGAWPGKLKAAVHAVVVALGLAAVAHVLAPPWPMALSVDLAVAASVLSGVVYAVRYAPIVRAAFADAPETA
jgi:CDP-diacylglycerol--glycerol-3-phosphate 3-phosphatidyltransferase